LLRIDQVSKRFGQVTALNAVSLHFQQGRIYGLAGENGAGKSTLVKILAGVHAPDAGRLEFEGRPFQPANPAEAEALGISVFHQEIPICPNLSVAANVFLGQRLPGRRFFPDWRALEGRCADLFEQWLGLKIDPRRPIGDCSAAERQLALLLRALSRKARLIILDEPTTALTPAEVARLFTIMRRLKAQGLSLIFISHLLDELMEIADEIYVMRDGSLVGHLEPTQFDGRELARLIAGRALASTTNRQPNAAFSPKLEVRSLSRPGHFQNVSLTVGTGEVLGITGLQGSGRTEMARALFAAPPAASGEIYLDGRRLELTTPQDAIRAGIGYVPEDRKSLGLFDDLDIQLNLALLRLRSLGKGGFLSRRRLAEFAAKAQAQLGIKMSGGGAPITSLSGGNQQKVLIARWLAIQPQVLVMNEPTRGVDIGAKDEIWRLIRSVAAEGCSFVIVSSDLEELVQLADRILVLRSGRVAAELSGADASKERLIHAAGSEAADSAPFPSPA
jgi:ABC-type sugar transport system ATPase subunit